MSSFMRFIRRLVVLSLFAAAVACWAGSAQAVTYWWDATAGGAINDGAGAWLGAGLWNNGSPSQTWVSGSDAGFGAGSAGGAVTLASPTTVNSLTFNAFTGTYTLGTAGQTITLNAGITMNAGAGAVAIISPVSLGGDQTWTNNSTNALTVNGGVNNNGNTLTIDGSGITTFLIQGGTGGAISGNGGITKNGSGLLILGGNPAPAHNYTGTTTINGGIVRFSANLPATSGLTLNGGVYEEYWSTNLTRTLGSGAGQVQILGGVSGFSENGATGMAVILNNNAATEVQWGSAYFNPSTLVLQAPTAQNGSSLDFQNKIDLNGATRTVAVNVTTTANATMSGVIRNTTGTAGLTKTGPGMLKLYGANTFNGGITISQGTLSINSINTVANANPLGKSSADAANLLLASGTTLQYTGGAASTDRSFTINGTANGDYASLDASGTGAVSWTNTASPAYGTVDQTRTLILTGSYAGGNNTLAANIANNGTGAVSVTKTGAGLWVLSGTSTYTGPTTISGGTLSVGASANLGGSSSSLVFNGGTLQITGTSLTNFSGIGHTVSFTSGQTVGLDINNVGNTFTADQTLNQGTGGLTKAGAGTLVINQSNTYTGLTTISAGTLQLNDNGTMSPAPLLDNGTFTVNRLGTVTLGTDVPAIIGGTGSVANIGSGTLVFSVPTYYTGTTKATAGTITLSHALAIQQSALDTTGGGTVTLSGVTTPTFGGLSGATGNLATVITSGYGSVTNLTLNPTSGSVTYGGVIANGSGDMTLTKIGAGTQVLQGANSYSGITYLNAGTLTLSGSGSILNSAVTLSGGGLTLSYADSDTETAFNRVNDSNGITANGGTITYTTTTAASTRAFAETIGAVALTSGQLNIVESLNKTAGSQTLTLGASGSSNNLTHTGTTNTSAVTFSSAGSRTTFNQIVVTGATATDTDKVIGPWATIGTTAAAQTDYAIYNASAQVVDRSTTATPNDTTWSTTWADTSNYNFANGTTGTTLSSTKNINTLRHTGGAEALTVGTGANLGTYGILNGVASTLTVAATGAGAVTLPTTTAGNLYVTTGSGAITISAPINDNSGALTLVKNGSNTLTLSGTSGYTGGTVINAGQVTVTTDANLGAANTAITFNGSAQLNNGGASDTTVDFGSRPITLNNGAIATFSMARGQKYGTAGAVTGSGGVTVVGGSGNTHTVSLLSTANTFTGPITYNAGDAITILVKSLADSASPITLNSGGALTYGSGAIANLTLNSRQFVLAGGGTINNASTQSLTINTDIGFSGTGARSLTLGTATGASTFAGRLTDNAGGALSLNLNSSWVLSGTNSYSGQTTFAGTPVVTIQGSKALSPNTTLYMNSNDSTASSTLKLLDDGVGTINLGNTVLIRDNNAPGNDHTFFVGNNGTANGGNGAGGTTGSTIVLGTLNFTYENVTSAVGRIPIQGGNGYRLQFNNVILNNANLQGVGTASTTTFWPTTANVTLGNVTMATGNAGKGVPYLVLDGTSTDNRITGVISDAADAYSGGRPLNVTKQSTSTWTFSGANTYTGGTTISAGKLIFSGANALPTAGTVSVAAAGHLSLADGTAQSFTVPALTLTSLANLSFDWTGNNTGDQLTSTANITPAASSIFPVIVNHSGTPDGSVTLLTGGAGSTLSSSKFYLANNTDYTAALTTTATTVSIGSYASQTALNTIYWMGNKLAGANTAGVDNAWALSDGTKSNWSSANTTYAATALTPGATADVIFSNALTGRAQQSTTLGTDVTVNSVVIDDATSVTIAGANNAALTLMSGLSTAGTVSGTSGSAITVTSNANATSTISARILLGADQTWNVASGKNLAVSGVVDGGYSLTKADAGTLTLSGANTYGGVTMIKRGTLTLGVANALPTGTTVTLGDGTTNDSGILKLDRYSQQLAGLLTAGSGSGNRVVNGNGTAATLTLNIASTNAFGGILGGSGTNENNFALTKAGAGTLTLSGVNTFTGVTTISGGTLSINSIADWAATGATATALGAPASAANGTIAIGSGGTAGTLVYTGGAQNTNRVINLAGINGGATIDQSGTGLLKFTSALTATGAGAKTLTLQGSTAGTGELAGAIVDNSGGNTTSVTKTGTGVWALTGANTYTGPTTISGGTLQLGNSTTIGSLSTASAIVDNGTLAFNRTNAVVQGTDFNSVIAGTGGILQAGTGTTTLNGVNSYSGTTEVRAGTLALSGSGTLGNGANNLTMSGGTLDLGATTNRTVGAVSITAAAASGDTIRNGSLKGTSYAASHNSGNAIVSANLLVNGAAGLTKSNGGTLTLSGANTFTGPTTVSGGALYLGTGGSMGATAVTVATGATYGLQQLADSTATISAGSSLSMNDGAILDLWDGGFNTMVFSGASSRAGVLTTAATVRMDLGYYLGTPLNDQITFGGSLTGKYNLQFTGISELAAGMPYTLMTATSGISASNFSAPSTLDVNGITYNLNLTNDADGKNLVLTATTGGGAIPTQEFALTSPTGTVHAHAGSTVSLTGALSNTGSGDLVVALTSTGALDVTGLNSTLNPVNSVPATITGTIHAGSTLGTQAWQVTNTDAAATNPTATIGGSVTVYSGTGVFAAASGNWSDFGNWTTDGGVPGLAAGFQTGGDTATFSGAGGTVTLDASPVVGSVTFNGSGNYAIAVGGGTLTLAGGSAAINNTSGSNSIAAAVQLNSTVTATVSVATDTLTVGGAISGVGGISKTGAGKLLLNGANSYAGTTAINNGTLELGSSAGANVLANYTNIAGVQAGGVDITASSTVIFDGASAGTIEGILKTGATLAQPFSEGQIRSSTAGVPANNRALGWASDAGKVTVMYTLYGDATLDGVVNFDDLSKVLTNYNNTGNWSTGDVTYDGTVNFDDLSKVLTAYNTSIGAGATGSGTPSFGSTGGFTVVPEPSSVVLLIAGLMGLLAYGWRKRK